MAPVDENPALPPKKNASLPLTLVSPHPRGPVVTDAQTALKDNPYGDFLQSAKVDGEFGPWTMRATKRAKHWLGYTNVNGQYGPELHSYLTGERKLPADKRLLRRKRIKARNTKPAGERAVEFAMVDYRNRVTEDPPGSNRNYITAAYKLVGAWCAMAVSMWWHKAKARWPLIGAGYRGREHYCPTILAKAIAGDGFAMVKVDRVQAGDLVLFDWGSGDGVADHVALFVKWVQKGVTFETVEGNTSYGTTGSQSDGGAVATRVRHINDVVRTSRGDHGFVHPLA